MTQSGHSASTLDLMRSGSEPHFAGRKTLLVIGHLSRAVSALEKAMRRRDFIKAIAGSAITWPLVARAQQAAMPVIGFMSSRSPEDSQMRSAKG